jgi:RNA methyltransferase, TrmH family
VTEVLVITARHNPLLQRVRRLASDPGAYRKLGVVWLEGEHLLGALAERGQVPLQVLVAASAWEQPALRLLAGRAPRVAVVADELFDSVSALGSPGRLGALVALPPQPPLQPDMASLVLDRVQDAGNVGSMLRSAAAFGVRQVLAVKGTAALWSSKVLRAGMGAHFGLHLLEGLHPADLEPLRVPLVGTALQGAKPIDQASLPWPCAWVLGHEGQGVAADLLARCALTVRIPQPGGEESLNVAAAAAVCLYESVRGRR